MEPLNDHVTENDRETLLGRLATALTDRPELVFAYAHGSFLAPGTFRDLDVAVYHRQTAPHGPDHRYEAGLQRGLQKLLDMTCPLDVRLLNTAPLAFRFHAMCGRLLLDRDPELRIEITTRTALSYLDIAPILRHHAREAFSHAAGS